jgi:hypothetical protein
MCNKQQIIKEIDLLESIKKCYLHFLCSHKAGTSVENTTYILANKEIIKQSLRDLYQKLDAIKRKEGLVSNMVPRSRRQQSTDFEAKAIMLFNKDYRFNITE